MHLYDKLPASELGNGYTIFIFRDYFNRIVRLIPTRDIKSETVVQVLEENIFKYLRLTEAIISDNVRLFMSNIIKDIGK